MTDAQQYDPGKLDITQLQNDILAIPENINIAMLGGRASGKTQSLPLLTFRHCMTYGTNAKVLIIRQQWRDLSELMDLFVTTFSQLLQEPDIRKYWNKADSRWRLPNGATVSFTQCENRIDYNRHHGKNYSLLIFEELPAWPSPVVFDLLRSTLRQPNAIRRIIVTGNPGLQGHSWCLEAFIKPADAIDPNRKFVPFIERGSGQMWCLVRNNMTDNPFLPKTYRAQIEAMRERNPELAEAWISGNWNIQAGNYFSAVLSPQRNRVRRWAKFWPDRPFWKFVVGYDHGTRAPCALCILAVAQDDVAGGDGTYYKRGSVVLVAELHSATDADPNRGKGWNVEETAERIIEVLDDWQLPHSCIADDAVFSDHGNVSIASTFDQYGLRLRKAHKGDRVGGWTILSDLMASAEQEHRRDAPGFYYSEDCTYFADCAFAIQTDERNPLDLDTTGPDHILDCVRYALINALRPDEYFEVTTAPWAHGQQRVDKRRFKTDPRYRDKIKQRQVAVDLSAGSKTFFPSIFKHQR